jgi:hypothetical protein
MQVKDTLPGAGAAIADDSEAAVDDAGLARCPLAGKQHLAEQCLILCSRRVQRRDVPTRDDEHVHGRTWRDVVESNDMLVGEQHPGRELTGGDTAEGAPIHGWRIPAPQVLLRSLRTCL